MSLFPKKVEYPFNTHPTTGKSDKIIYRTIKIIGIVRKKGRIGPQIGPIIL